MLIALHSTRYENKHSQVSSKLVWQLDLRVIDNVPLHIMYENIYTRDNSTIEECLNQNSVHLLFLQPRWNPLQ